MRLAKDGIGNQFYFGITQKNNEDLWRDRDVKEFFRQII
jgi:hypothetical protein